MNDRFPPFAHLPPLLPGSHLQNTHLPYVQNTQGLELIHVFVSRGPKGPARTLRWFVMGELGWKAKTVAAPFTYLTSWFLVA